MFNFLYCFDSNYNVQATVSMLSLLDNVQNKINIFIIHENPKSFHRHLKKIKKNKNLNDIQIYKFNETKYDFPNLNEAHVTYATYFRVFIEKYLPTNLDYVIYIDADILCLKNPEIEIKQVISKLKVSNFPLAGLTEAKRENAEEYFKNLGIKNDQYFNAGLIIIDYKKWLENNLTDNLLDLMKKRYTKIIYWDQDLLNLFFDGNYLEMSKSLNFSPPESVHTKMLNDENQICFLHYSGSKKPWYFENVFLELSNYYQMAYKKYFQNKFHATLKLKKHEIRPLLLILKSLNINIADKFKFIYAIIKSNLLRVN